MSKPIKIILSLILLGTVLLIVTMPTLAKNPIVMMVDVEGETQVPATEILGTISTTRIGMPFSEQAAYQDMRLITSLGCFSSVTFRVEQFFDGIKVVFVVIENPTVKDIKINGLSKIEPDKFQEFISQKSDQIFNGTILRSDISKASKHFFDKNGICIELKTMNISPEGIVNLELVELKVGKITITGLKKTQEHVVRREFSLKEGEIFDTNILYNDIQKLMRLQLFSAIVPDISKSNTPDALDINIKIDEASKQAFTFTTSYEETTGKTGFGIGYEQPNLMGLGQRLSLNVKSNPSSADFSFYEPWLDEKHTSFGISMWHNDIDMVSTMRNWSPNLNEKYDLDLLQTGLSVSFGRPIGKYTKAVLKLKAEKNEITDFWIKDSNEQTSENSLTIPEPKYHSQNFWDNTIGFNVRQDRLNYKTMFYVLSGHHLYAGYTYSGSALGSDFSYQQIKVEGKWFQQLAPNLVFGTRIECAYLTGDYPDYNSYYIGGPNKLRGYDGQRFKNDYTADLIGSKYILHSSELRYRIPKYENCEFALFYDIGQVINNGYDVTKSDYGIGLRLELPFLGLVRLDRAWNEDGGNKTVIALGYSF